MLSFHNNFCMKDCNQLFFFLPKATILCDIVVLYVVKKRDVYKSMKYQSVAEDTANVSIYYYLWGVFNFLKNN